MIPINQYQLIKKYSSFIRRLSNRYAKSYNENYKDLYQEGICSLLEAYNLIDQSKSRGEIDSFFRNSIKWGLLSYVASNHSDVKCNKNKFFNGEILENEDEVEVVLSGMNPEDLYILFEEKEILDNLIVKFESTLADEKERFIWFNVIKTDTPMTTREAAEAIGVSSNKTISNIRLRIEEKFHEFYTGKELTDNETDNNKE